MFNYNHNDIFYIPLHFFKNLSHLVKIIFFSSQVYGFKYSYLILIICTYILGGCPRGVMVKTMDCGIVVREFVLQLRYYVHFRANTLGKGMG